MDVLSDVFDFISDKEVADLLLLLVLLTISFLLFYVIYKVIAKALLKKAKTKKQNATVFMFLKILKYTFVFIIFIVTVFVYFGSWEQMPIVLGFITVALGLALQKPITSILAWVMIAIRRPFAIGDRIIIDNIKGDIRDITLTHIYLDEVGGTFEGEERSERDIVVPNSIFFDKDIINYTGRNEYILDEVKVTITYESNLKKAEDLILKATRKVMEAYWDTLPNKYQKEPHIRLRLKDSGIDVRVRYYSLAYRRSETSTRIIRDILNTIKKTKDVQIAYPHTEIVFKE